MEAYTLSNQCGMKLRAMSYGAIVLSLETPDRAGKSADVVLGYQTLAEYIKDTPYFGAIVGRFGNRIAKGKFTLEGKTYTLATNNTPADMPCSLHGGLRGFDKVVWQGEGLAREGAQGVRFRYTSKDGEEGYPGNLKLSVTYWLTESSEWQVEFEATTDKATPVNVTQHSYFNLKGEGRGDILGHELQIAASKFTPVNAGMIPTGQILPVAGTPLDFTKATAIGARIEADYEQLKLGGGYDHNWVLDSQDGKLAHAATAYEPTSGRQLEVLTTEPGIQFYCGTSSMAACVAKPVPRIKSATASASKPSIIRTPRTIRNSPPASCFPARRCAARRCSVFPRAKRRLKRTPIGTCRSGDRDEIALAQAPRGRTDVPRRAPATGHPPG